VNAIVLRPDLKTPGGEIHDVLWNERYVGNMTLVYREQERISGAVQLDSSSISAQDQDEVIEFVHTYIQNLIMAVGAVDCDVIVTSSAYDHIITTDAQDEFEVLGDESPDVSDQIEMQHTPMLTKQGRRGRRGRRRRSGRQEQLKLLIVGESRNRIEYHVYNSQDQWMAEAFFTVDESECSGTIVFMHKPHEDEIDAVIDLIVSDYDESQIDLFDIQVEYKGRTLERIELEHEALRKDDFTVLLARDDGDILTYEIYNPSSGGLPIGTATVDISHRQLSGFLDFKDLYDEDQRETIATLLMRELDKEKEFRSIHLAIMHHNEKVDEMVFESQTVH